MYSLILLVILHIVPLSVSRRQDIVSCRSDCQMARMCRPRRLNDRHQNTRQQNQPNRHVLCEVQLLVRYRALLCRATTPPGEAEFKPRDPWRRAGPRAKMIPRGVVFPSFFSLTELYLSPELLPTLPYLTKDSPSSNIHSTEPRVELSERAGLRTYQRAGDKSERPRPVSESKVYQPVYPIRSA